MLFGGRTRSLWCKTPHFHAWNHRKQYFTASAVVGCWVISTTCFVFSGTGLSLQLDLWNDQDTVVGAKIIHRMQFWCTFFDPNLKIIHLSLKVMIANRFIFMENPFKQRSLKNYKIIFFLNNLCYFDYYELWTTMWTNFVKLTNWWNIITIYMKIRRKLEIAISLWNGNNYVASVTFYLTKMKSDF